jgi:hypothetical protein
VSTEDGLCYFINCMYLVIEFYNLCLGKTNHATSYRLGEQTVPTEDRLLLLFNKVVSCLIITCIE